MPQLSTAQARIVDPILTTVAHGYTHPERVGRKLFPVIHVPARGGRVIKFGKEAFVKYNLKRSPGANTKRIQVGYASDPISLTQDAIEGLVPIEYLQEASAVPNLDVARDLAINPTMDIITNAEELEQAAKATNASNYDADHKVTLTTTDKWTHADSDPAGDVKTAKEAIRKTTGHYPNIFILKPSDFNALCEHPKIQERFKFTSSDSVTTSMLANYFDVDEVVVGKAVWVPNEDADFEDAWKASVLAFVPKGSQTLHTPSYGYTYRLQGYSIVEKPYFDNGAKSWVYPTTDERQINMTAMGAGYLFSGAS